LDLGSSKVYGKCVYVLPDIIAVGGINHAGDSRVEIESGIFLLVRKRNVSDGIDGEYPYDALLGSCPHEATCP
jgi:hypothetical protein